METTQETTVYLDTPELKVYSNTSLKFIVLQASGVVPSDIYRQGLSLATEIAIKEQLLFWLVNNREGGIITPADQIWANEVSAPLLAKGSCIRKMAIIEPKDLHSKIILEDMMDKARDVFPFEMQFFGDVPSAHAWFLDTEATVFRTAAVSAVTSSEGRASF
ncbi:hypothetical protein DXT99_06025 [Pontibacter diazotrophicus]|uniref:STAS/SEC14 domain-containing protein n=1 Tax=Pontibacter diazotrophicus TaxID=1400979 RepID=A0A3D8LFN3_9BACT|nr:hypothetical protein DXT99_06025 [Pontibacter diazotrophicus]